MSDTLFGLVLFVALFVVSHGLRSILHFSIDIEEEARTSDPGYHEEAARSLNTLRTLDIVTDVVFCALLPIGLVVLNIVLPEPFRVVLENYIRPATLIVASVVGLCAYWAVFSIFCRNLGPKIYKALKKVFRPVGE